MDSLIALLQPAAEGRDQQAIVQRAGNAVRDSWTSDRPLLTWSGTGISLQAQQNQRAPDSGVVWLDGQDLVYIYGHVRVPDQAGLAFCLPSSADLTALARYLLNGYTTEGTAIFAKLSGSFLILIYQAAERRLVVASDRLGSRPVYYCRTGQSLALATDIRGLLAQPQTPRRIDPASAVEFLRFNMVLGDRTLYQDIHCLPPASVMIVMPEDFAIRNYWSMAFSEKDDRGEVWYVEALADAFCRALTGIVSDGAGTAIMLSGGLDSRVISAALAADKKTIHAISFGEFENDDVKLAKDVARALHWKHSFIHRPANYYRDILGRAVQLGGGLYSYYHAHALGLHDKLHALGIGTVLEGWGLDLLFSGTYMPRRMLHLPLGKGIELLQLQQLPPSDGEVINWLLGRLGLPVDETFAQLAGPVLCPLWQDWPRQVIAETLTGQAGKARNSYDRCDLFAVERFPKFRSYLFPLSMRAGVRQRNPMFDNEVLDLFLSMPAHLRFNGRVYRKMLARLAPNLARIPYSRSGVPLTYPAFAENLLLVMQPIAKTVRMRLRHWRHAYSEYPAALFDSYPDPAVLVKLLLADEDLWRVLLHGRYIDAGLVQATVVQEMVARHLAGRANYGYALLGLLTLASWLEEWL